MMLRNPIHKRLERLSSWQHITFMACLCERMYPNYQLFCQQAEFDDAQFYRRVLDLVWETLVSKGAKVNFDNQLEKLENRIPCAELYDIYAVYPAIDACQALGELLHSQLSGETLQHAVAVSKISIHTMATLEMTQANVVMTEEQLKALPAIRNELDIQWQIFRLLVQCEKRDIELINSLRSELREVAISNIGVNLV